MKGRAAVREGLAARPRDRRTRHLVSNLDVRFAGPDAATARCDILVFQGPSDPDGGPTAVDGPASLITNEDRLVREAGRWRIRSKHPEAVFRIVAGAPARSG